MNAIGIISEYNPLHKGHQHHMKMTRTLLQRHDAPIVCVMSGSVTQRGDFSILSKWARAEAAIQAGANLVLELPAPFACACAEQFANGGVYLLAATGVVDTLSFGSECGNITALQRLCHEMVQPGFDMACRAALGEGLSYPAAAAQAAKEHLTSEESSLLDTPNNMLGLCYLKALRSLGAPMTPFTLSRQGAAHDALVPSKFPSATMIRRCMSLNQPLVGMVPKSSHEIILRERKEGRAPISFAAYERLVLSTLRRLTIEQWAALTDVSEGLESRLYKGAGESESLAALYESVKTKRYTLARLRRVILRAYLGIPDHLLKQTPPYLRVLALDDQGAGLLHQMRQTARLPVLTKPASYTQLSDTAKEFFQVECAITDRIAFHRPSLTGSASGAELRTSPVVIQRQI